MDTTLLFTLLISWLVIFITQLAKKKWYNQKIITLIIVWVLAIGYRAFQTFIPNDIQTNILTAITSIVGIAKILYDAITSLLPKSK